MTFPVAGRALALASALCFVFVTRVFVDFDAVRIKLVQRPAVPSNGRTTIDMPPARGHDAIPAPAALIARIRNDSATAAAFTVAVDGRAVCQRTVSANRAARVDCTARDWTAGAAHQIDLSGPPGSWTLEYFEAATHHGATRAHDLMIAPVGARYAAPSWWLTAIVWAALALSFLVVPAKLPRFLARLHAAGCVLIAIAFALLVLSPFVSSYLLLSSWSAFVYSVSFLLIPQLCAVPRLLARSWDASRNRPFAAAGISAAVVLAAYGAVVARHMRQEYGGNYSGFIQLSLAQFDKDPMLRDRPDVRGSLILRNDGGYDSQFMYFEIYDPFLRRYSDRPAIYSEYIDSPPYRYARIGFPLLTKIFAADRWQLYPEVMTWLILGSIALSGFFLSAIARAEGGSAVWGLAVILIPGFWTSLQTSLPEPIAAALVLAGYWLFLRDRLGWSSAAFGLSILVRETGAIFVICLSFALLLSRGWRISLRFGAAALLPIALWRLYVGWVLLPDTGRDAVRLPLGFGVPLSGFFELWTRISRGQYFPDVQAFARAGIAYPLLLVGGFSITIAFAIAYPGPLAFAAVLFATMGISLKYDGVWSHVINGQRVTYETFLMLALLSLGIGTCSRRLRAALLVFWIGAAAYVFLAGVDAEYIRDTLFQRPF